MEFKQLMIDKSSAEIKALTDLGIFYLLCIFHMLQDVERFCKSADMCMRHAHLHARCAAAPSSNNRWLRAADWLLLTWLPAPLYRSLLRWLLIPPSPVSLPPLRCLQDAKEIGDEFLALEK